MIPIIAGHSVLAPGAIAYDGTTEHELNVEFQDNILSKEAVKLIGSSIFTDDDKQSLANVVKTINALKYAEYGLDIHFNNNNPKATGIEVIISPNTPQSNKNRATWLVHGLNQILELPIRQRVATRDYIYPSETPRGTLAMIDQTDIPMIILETCFLNKKDLTRYRERKKKVWDFVFEVFFINKF